MLANSCASRLLFATTLALVIEAAVALAVDLVLDHVVDVDVDVDVVVVVAVAAVAVAVAVGFSTATNQLSRVGVCGFTGP
ncbi:hypothetical protein SOM22_20515 [Stenotrophomonas rhizophila]|uniref:hypothetical protein n=1 Tax=Stenotrophomonas rhizophila TaxID=216778 RepID=UPI002A6A08BB|nr:hypothetical protein [Stenotrophomonas rhizophila]MDY0956959.1 hypothetical protein [Stenotrophomonas rhizophila]